jgi:hypothetical protein
MTYIAAKKGPSQAPSGMTLGARFLWNRLDPAEDLFVIDLSRCCLKSRATN